MHDPNDHATCEHLECGEPIEWSHGQHRWVHEGFVGFGDDDRFDHPAQALDTHRSVTIRAKPRGPNEIPWRSTYAYTCDRGHHAESDHPLTSCLATPNGEPCPGTLTKLRGPTP